MSSSTISSLEMHSSVWELSGCWNLLSGIVNRAHRSVCCSAWLWGPLEMSNLIGMIGYGAVGSVLPRSNGEGCQQIGRNPNTAQPQSSAVPPNPTSKVKKSSLAGFSLTCSCGFLSISFCFLLSKCPCSSLNTYCTWFLKTNPYSTFELANLFNNNDVIHLYSGIRL